MFRTCSTYGWLPFANLATHGGGRFYDDITEDMPYCELLSTLQRSLVGARYRKMVP